MTELALLGRHGLSDLVAFGAAGERTAGDLLRDAAVIAAALPPVAQASQVLLVFQHDRYAMAAALLGSWAVGHAVALPPSTQRDAIWWVADRPETVAILHDTQSGSPIAVPPILAAAPNGRALDRAAPVNREVIATVFTSGTTSAMVAWPKRSSQLLGEASMLVSAFGLEPGMRFVPTVPPGHIYGLLFTVLAPLLSGGAFLRETPLHAESIAERVKTFGARVLVTVPAHLPGLAAVDAGRLASVERVFASTAPLPEETADAFFARHGRAITEVLGSTETGGIAHRARPGTPRFTPLPGVAISVDDEGRLLVDSPFVDHRGDRPFRTADLGSIEADGTLLHRGRADGIVKVGGRRVSLPAMEEFLGKLEGVSDVAVVAVPAGAERGHQILAALVAKDWTPARLKEAMGARFEASSLPRRFVLVDALPREENGKLRRAHVLRLFGLRPDGQPINWSLGWGEAIVSRDGDRHRHVFPVHVPEDYGWYEGHFPGYPILAGAVQLHELVMPCVRRVRPDLGSVRQMSRLKFLGRIKPDEAIEVVLRYEGREVEIDFELVRDGKTCSAGHLSFEERAP